MGRRAASRRFPRPGRPPGADRPVRRPHPRATRLGPGAWRLGRCSLPSCRPAPAATSSNAGTDAATVASPSSAAPAGPRRTTAATDDTPATPPGGDRAGFAPRCSIDCSASSGWTSRRSGTPARRPCATARTASSSPTPSRTPPTGRRLAPTRLPVRRPIRVPPITGPPTGSMPPRSGRRSARSRSSAVPSSGCSTPPRARAPTSRVRPGPRPTARRRSRAGRCDRPRFRHHRTPPRRARAA